jgi:DNA invertase Pin-like site-specific DNA recombinase
MSGTEVYLLPMITSGGDAMVTGDVWHEIHARYKLKEPKKTIARGLGLDVRTVRRIQSWSGKTGLLDKWWSCSIMG